MRSRAAFTLIELVVVIMILGILATIAAPRLLNTTSRATDNGLKQTLAIVRDAIELYTAENHGQLPGQDSDLPGDIEQHIRGGFPSCPIGAGNADVVYATGALSADAVPTKGWKYATDTGEFIVNSGDALPSDSSMTYDQL
jgi:general secretion pathway protein G